MRFVFSFLLLLAFAIPANAQTAEMSGTTVQWAEVDIYSWVGTSTTTKDFAQDDDREPNTGSHTFDGYYTASVSNVDAEYNGGDDISHCHSCYFSTSADNLVKFVEAKTIWSFDVDTKTTGYEAEMECEGRIITEGDMKYTGGDATEVMLYEVNFDLRRPHEDSISQYGWKYIAEIGAYNRLTAEYEVANDRWKIHGYKLSSTGSGLPTNFTDYVSPNINGAAQKTYTIYREQNRDQYEPVKVEVDADGVGDFVELIVDDPTVHADGNSMMNRVRIDFDSFQ